jgi:hypothetical protein
MYSCKIKDCKFKNEIFEKMIELNKHLKENH